MWRKHWKIVFVILGLCCLSTNYANNSTSTDSSPCKNKETCSSCIQTSGCAWCSKPNSIDQCRFYIASEDTSWCSKTDLVFPKSTKEITEDRPLKRAANVGEKSEEDAVQIRPQGVKLKLRVNESKDFDLHYAQAEGYPVDLYYLMDLSASMRDDKEKLSTLGDKLAEEMKNLTSNFRLGFGSFVDKVEMPFVSTVPDKLRQPCQLCAPPYGFMNNMPLSLDTAQFKEKVQKASISGNLDSPEGGLDALMQVIVCHKEIGWRPKARHIIILSTDAAFHVAGDGKLAGIVQPNDGECHLKDNEYTHGLLMDYPSISHINYMAKKYNTVIIFAVIQKQEKVYKELASRIIGASSGTLNDDSSNVVQLVKNQYARLVQSVKISDDASDLIETNYFSSCMDQNNEEMKTKECHGLRVGNEIKFRAEIKVLRCPQHESERHQTFEIKPQGLNEAVKVELEIICDCPCEKPGSSGYKENSDVCAYHGTLQCGVCACNEGYIGKNCECNRASAEDKPNGTDTCRPPGSDPDVKVCSGAGDCKCGVCICVKRQNPNEVNSGKYCECNNFSCRQHLGKFCSGQGTCKCGKCECLPGWTGEECNCRNSNDTCINPSSYGKENVEFCTGHGDCVCGKCVCKNDGETRYSGKYCQECPTCSGQCAELGPCVEFEVFGTSSMTNAKEKCDKSKINITIVEDLPRGKSNENDLHKDGFIEDTRNEQVHHCSLPDHADCIYSFNYWYDKEILRVHASRAKQCAPPVNVLGIVGGVIGSIVLAGLVLLLIWKLLTDIHDRREFVKFENERQMAKWDKGENPLYQKATATFSNPTFGK